MPQQRNEPPVKPIVVLWVFLAVAISIFAGSIAIGVFVIQDNRSPQTQDAP